MVYQQFTTKQVADLFGVTVRTVQLWANKGYVQVTRTARGHRRIAETELAKLRTKLKANASDETSSSNEILNDADSEGCLNILIVDDDEHMLMLYEGIMTEWKTPKVTVTTAKDGYQALIAIGKNDFDIVFTDILMPHMNGAVMINQIMTAMGDKSPEIVIVTSLVEKTLRQSYEIPQEIIVCEKPISYAQIHRIATQAYEEKYMGNS